MEGPFKPRLLVFGKGVEAMVRMLSDRADNGDQEAEGALDKLRDAFETAAKVLDCRPEAKEDEFLAVMQGLSILNGALEGSREYPRDVLRGIAKQVAEDLKRLGWAPLDIDGFFEFLEERD